MNAPAAGARPKIVVIAGPTAVGKTALGVELALRFDAEAVNADSRYLYRGFDIGVAKPTFAERRGVPHHLIDTVDPDEAMSLALYQEAAYAAIAGIFDRGKLPLLVGGTPLYVNAVVEGWRIPRVPPNPTFRADLEGQLEREGLPSLVARLAAVDPVAASRAAANPRRLIRALEIYEATGIPMSAHEGKGPAPYDALELGLTMPRERLHAAIDARVDDQIAAGLVDEVRRLLASGLAPGAPAMSALGYRQLLPFLAGACSLDEAVARIKVDTHRYVRHQETWLRRNPRLLRVGVTEAGWRAQVESLVRTFLAQSDRVTGHPEPRQPDPSSG